MQCKFKLTDRNIKTLQDNDLSLLSEKKFKGKNSAAMGLRYVKSNIKKRYYT